MENTSSNFIDKAIFAFTRLHWIFFFLHLSPHQTLNLKTKHNKNLYVSGDKSNAWCNVHAQCMFVEWHKSRRAVPMGSRAVFSASELVNYSSLCSVVSELVDSNTSPWGVAYFSLFPGPLISGWGAQICSLILATWKVGSSEDSLMFVT